MKQVIFICKEEKAEDECVYCFDLLEILKVSCNDPPTINIIPMRQIIPPNIKLLTEATGCLTAMNNIAMPIKNIAMPGIFILFFWV